MITDARAVMYIMLPSVEYDEELKQIDNLI